MTVAAITPLMKQVAPKALNPAAQVAYDAASHRARRGITHAITSGGVYLTLEHIMPLVLWPINGTFTAIMTGYHAIRSGRHFMHGLFDFANYRKLR
jgi:hypothetical protein